MERIQWDDLAPALKDRIAARTGPVITARAVTDGQNSPLAAVVETTAGKVFVKGLPSSHRQARTQNREAAAAQLVSGISPQLLWQFDEGWNVLGFEHIQGRAASYAPGSPDLPLITRLMGSLATVKVPDDHGPVKYADDRWKPYLDDPRDAQALTGTALLHTDWMPDNVIISDGRAWLIDWAWATIGAPWIDPACWLVRLIAHGHPIREAEATARQLPAYASADPAHVAVFARANANTWNEIEHANPAPWTQAMTAASRAWAAHRETAARP